MRTAIENWKEEGRISDNLYYFLLCSLLECADKVANTASVYGAYLKNLKKSAQKELVLEPAEYELNDNEHKVFNKDANELIKEIEGDILYLDPPYNARQYGANYHMLNTIAEIGNDDLSPHTIVGKIFQLFLQILTTELMIIVMTMLSQYTRKVQPHQIILLLFIIIHLMH